LTRGTHDNISHDYTHYTQDTVIIAMHDVERPVERRIMKEIVASQLHAEPLGVIKGKAGHLAAFRIIKHEYSV
jgi:hypothetical protein